MVFRLGYRKVNNKPPESLKKFDKTGSSDLVFYKGIKSF